MSHIEMEMLTIGPWKADRYRVSSSDGQFFSQLMPGVQLETLVAAYRTFRQIESVEIDEMSPEALDAWRVLTVAVARADCADAPENLAEDWNKEYSLWRFEDPRHMNTTYTRALRITVPSTNLS